MNQDTKNKIIVTIIFHLFFLGIIFFNTNNYFHAFKAIAIIYLSFILLSFIIFPFITIFNKKYSMKGFKLLNLLLIINTSIALYILIISNYSIYAVIYPFLGFIPIILLLILGSDMNLTIVYYPILIFYIICLAITLYGILTQGNFDINFPIFITSLITTVYLHYLSINDIE